MNSYIFSSLKEVRKMCAELRKDYNEERPHKSLGYLSPLKYAERYYRQTANGNTLKIEASRLPAEEENIT
jgi:putative transposase